MIKWLVLFVLLTLAFASSVHAYTYTCEEGKFQIDVPDGWVVDELVNGVQAVKYFNGEVLVSFSVECGYQFDNEFLEFMGVREESTNDIQYMHNDIINNIKQHFMNMKDDIYLTDNEAKKMGIDDGFVFFLEDLRSDKIILGILKKGSNIYLLQGWIPNEYYEEEKNQIIKSLNSFRALD